MSKKKAVKKKQSIPSDQKRIIILISSLAIIGIVLIIVAIGFLQSGKPKPLPLPLTRPEEKHSVVNDVKNPEDIYFYISRKTADVQFENPKDNQSYLMFTVILKDTDEIIYTSPYLEPGNKIEQIPVSLELVQGEYDIIVQCSMFLMQDKTPIGGTSNLRILHVYP